MGRVRLALLSGIVSIALIVSNAPAHAALTVIPISSAQYPVGLDSDSFGNIYIASDTNPTSGKLGLIVIPSASGTLFGQSVTANQEFLLFTSTTVRGVAVNPTNDVFFSLANGNVYVIARTTKSVFGVSVTANAPTLINQGAGFSGGIEFDGSGNLFGIGLATNQVSVIPNSTGTLFGVSVTANTRAVVLTKSGGWFWDLTIDPQNNILVADGWGNQGVWILSSNTGTYYQQSVVANTFTRITTFNSTFGRAAGIDADANGNLFIVNYGYAVFIYSPLGITAYDQTIPATTLTLIAETASGGRTDQGVAVMANGDLISGGGSSTFRISSQSQTPTPTPTPAPVQSSSSVSIPSGVDTPTTTVTTASVQISTSKFIFAKSSSFVNKSIKNTLATFKTDCDKAASIKIVASAGYLNGVPTKHVQALALKRAQAIKATLVQNGIDANKINIELNVVKFGATPKSSILYTL